jgi:hypothetical protein
MATIVRGSLTDSCAPAPADTAIGGGEGERRAAQDARHARIIVRLTSTRPPHNAYDFGVGDAVSAFTAMACQ